MQNLRNLGQWKGIASVHIDLRSRISIRRDDRSDLWLPFMLMSLISRNNLTSCRRSPNSCEHQSHMRSLHADPRTSSLVETRSFFCSVQGEVCLTLPLVFTSVNCSYSTITFQYPSLVLEYFIQRKRTTEPRRNWCQRFYFCHALVEVTRLDDLTNAPDFCWSVRTTWHGGQQDRRSYPDRVHLCWSRFAR